MKPALTPAPSRWNSLPLIQHQDGGGPPAPTPPAPPAPAPPAPTPPAPGTVTQAQLDEIVKREKGSTKEATEKAIAESFGCTLEEAKAYVASAKAADDKNKSEAQLAKEAADKAKLTSDEETAKAKVLATETRVERALARAGVPIVAAEDEDQDKIDAKLATMVGLIKVDPGADDDTIKGAVAALKDTMPELFTGIAPKVDPSAPPKPGGGNPPKPPPTPKPAEDAMKKGADRLKGTQRTSGYAWENDPATAST